VLAERDYHLLLDYAPSEMRQEETQIEALKQKRVDGFPYRPSDDDPESPDGAKPATEHYRALEEEKIPFVFVDRFVPGLTPIMSPPTTFPPPAPRPAICFASGTSASRMSTPRTA
jgi:DNA-binding LacI/PurR family transcriptional regulator